MEFVSEIVNLVHEEGAANQGQVSRVIQVKLTSILKDLMEGSGGIVGCMLSSKDGFAWAEQLQSGMDRHRFAAMSSALLAVSDNLVKESHGGTPKDVLIESDKGNLFVMHAGSNLLLTVFTDTGSNLGLSLAHARKATEEVAVLNLGSSL